MDAVTFDSTQFEQHITRIQELLESLDAKITWNDHVPDPDNPAQPRQIDITIKRDSKLTLVECRIHKQRQNVKWIEELIGRRISLGADHVIAVASAGFTKGACAKAAAYGIILRDFRKLTDEEIVHWDRSLSLTLLFIQYSDIKIQVMFAPEDLFKIDVDRFAKEIHSHPMLVAVFNRAPEVLRPCGLDPNVNWPMRFGFEILPQEDVFIAGQRIESVKMDAEARLIERTVACPFAESYGAPGGAAAERSAIIERFDLGETSIIHDGHRISILLDLSVVDRPPLTQFRYWRTSSEHDMEFECVELKGTDWMRILPGRMKITAGAYVPEEMAHSLPPTKYIDITQTSDRS
jgi:hypothetical protein